MAKILIVEDSKTQELLLKTTLEKAGHQVFCAGSGQLGIDLARQNIPEIIITDIRMPDMNGYEVSWAIKNDFRLKHIPVILLSQLSETKDIIIGLESLADSYVIKPFEEAELFSNITFLLENPVVSVEKKPLSVVIEGFTHPIHSNRRQILSFLLSTYDTVIHRNKQLLDVQAKLRVANDALTKKTRQLEVSEKRFRCLVETAPDIIYRIDEEGHIAFINQGIRKLGYEPEALIGKHFSCLIAPHQIDKVSRKKVIASLTVNTAKPTVSPKLFDERRSGNRRTSGLEILLKVNNSDAIVAGIVESLALEDEYIDMEVSSAGMYQLESDKEIFIGTVGIIRDITDRKMAEQSLQKAKQKAIQANNAKSAFLSKMSHELRTPLNAILGFSQLMMTSINEPLSADQNESVVQINQAGQHLLELINEILDLSSIEAGKLTLDIADYSANDFLIECVSMVEIIAVKNNIDFRYQDLLNDNSILVAVDLKRIRQVILNLLSNAIKYNKANGTVTLINQCIDNEHLMISIADTGVGMTDEFLKDIFTPFSRANQTQRVEGTGIGLAITKQLIESMNGRIQVTTEFGKGSVFTVCLPIVQSTEIIDTI